MLNDFAGEYLGSAGDGEYIRESFLAPKTGCTRNKIYFIDNVLLLWKQEVGGEGLRDNLLSDTANRENWTVVKILRGHLEDIYDLCWSCDSQFVITGSVDNSAIVWDIQAGESWTDLVP